MLREEIIFCDENAEYFSRTRSETMFSFSDFFNKRYGKDQYKCLASGQIVAKKARTINLTNLLNILRSKDQTELDSQSWMFDGEHRFLQGDPIKENKVAFIGFPRSGTSFCRKLVENVSGTVTGGTVSLHTATALQMMGLKGEWVVDDTTWIAKAHHPLNTERSLNFIGYKTFVLVRNPLDVFTSYAGAANTLCHSAKPQWEWEQDYPEWWDLWVKKQADHMKKYYDTIMRHCVDEKKNPVYFVRYEDLVANKKETLMGLFSFLLETRDLEGSNAERRIDTIVGQGESAGIMYKLKSTTAKFDAHRQRYTAAQIEYVKENLKEHLHFFGYTKNSEEENSTGFFDFEEDTQHQDKFMAFKNVNQDSLDEVSTPGWKRRGYHINVEGVWDAVSQEDKPIF